MQLPKTIEVNGIRVLLTRQLAEAYGTERQIISNNYTRKKKRYVEGKHVIILSGDYLKEFKASHQIDDNLKYAHTLYLQTEKGALLHAKSLNTDKAWEVYDYLVDFYFRAKEEPKPVPEAKPTARPLMRTVVDVPENPEILNAIQKLKDDVTCMQVLLDGCKVYTSEEAYKERRRAATEVVSIIVNDMNKWLNLKPRLIQKQYQVTQRVCYNDRLSYFLCATSHGKETVWQKL